MAGEDVQLVGQILKELQRIDGGSCWTWGWYHPNERDQGTRRLQVARQLARCTELERERRLAVARLWAAGCTKCEWCDREFVGLTGCLEVHGRILHAECGTEFDSWVSDDVKITVTTAGRAALRSSEVA
jgi:hypothetical protein